MCPPPPRGASELTHMLISSMAVLGVFLTTLIKVSAPSTVSELYAICQKTITIITHEETFKISDSALKWLRLAI